MNAPTWIRSLAQFAHTSQRRLAGTHLVLLALVILAASGLFLSPDPSLFPMDDSYIHLVYARNLADEGRLYFNAPDEQGVGTTSLLWVCLLAGGFKLGISGVVLSKALGALSLFIICAAVYQLTHPISGRRIAFLAGLLIALSGNMLWFAFSGMETTLFVAAALTALLAYRRKRWLLLGLLLGLMPLIRPEGILLFFTLAQIELVRRRKFDRSMAKMILPGLLLALPWFVYLIVRTGHPLPTSGVGKQATTDLAISHVLHQFPQLEFLKLFTPPIYVLSWIAYLLLFALGGMSLPGPVLPLSSLIGPLDYRYAWLALLVLASTVLPLLWPSLRRLVKGSNWRSWLADDNRRPFVILMVWIAFHNVVFALMLPIPGTASRYGAINHLALWWALALGFYFYRQRGPRLKIAWLALLALLASSNVIYWDQVYQANQEHMRRVRIQAARYVAVTPEVEHCAAFDIGALRLFGHIHVIDIGGLIDPDLQAYYHAGELDRYLWERGADCLILPGRPGHAEEGWIDFLSVSGLGTSDLFDVSIMATFEIEHDRWMLGYLPTNNYQDSVVIYRIVRR
ncbi:MAG: hypothetical protein PVF49_04925 [Anaerolineales bacterium]|jgi:hypothetical protein